jgi:2-polyprenyl-6-methoxyphenol hydroxylase-like FAD-dependent oxidoreductase
MTDRDVLISGASIAGPALAYLLHEAGYNPTVVERAPDLRPGGQTVDLRGAGRTVIERMGLMPAAKEVSLDQKGLALVDDKGRRTAEMPADAFGGEGIVSEIEILRGDLAQLLYDATLCLPGPRGLRPHGPTPLLPQVDYIFDDTITAIQQDDDGVTVTFENSETRRFALVFGADGLHSVTRALAFGPEERYVRSLDCYGAWFTCTADIELDDWYLMHNTPGGLVASARPGRLPGEIKAGLSFRSKPFSYDRRDTAAQRELLARKFAGAKWEVPKLVESMRTANDFFFDSTSQVHMDRWTNRRVALLGDAACCPTPLTGLGTSLALVGAYVLAGELAKARGDHRVAFDNYEKVMRPYVTSSQELPPGGTSGFAPMSKAGIWLRTASMRWMTRWPMKPLIAGQFAKAGDIALPDYDFATVN